MCARGLYSHYYLLLLSVHGVIGCNQNLDWIKLSHIVAPGTQGRTKSSFWSRRVTGNQQITFNRHLDVKYLLLKWLNICFMSRFVSQVIFPTDRSILWKYGNISVLPIHIIRYCITFSGLYVQKHSKKKQQHKNNKKEQIRKHNSNIQKIQQQIWKHININSKWKGKVLFEHHMLVLIGHSISHDHHK